MRVLLQTLGILLVGDRLRMFAAVLALVVASCLLYVAPLVPQAVIDGVLVPRALSEAPSAMLEALGGAAFLAEHLWVATVAFVGITAAAALFTHLRGRWAAVACDNAIARLRERLYDHLQHLPLAHFDRAESGDLVQRCTSDVATLRGFLATQLAEIGRAIVMLVVPLPLMIAIDPRMTLAALVLIPIVVGFSFLYFLRVRGTFTAVDEAEGRLTAALQENLTGIRVVRAFARQDYEAERFAVRNAEHRAATVELFDQLAWFWSVSDIVCIGQLGVVVAYGTTRLAEGTLGAGTFLYFLTAVAMFVFPLRMMGRILADLGKTVVAVGRMRQILDAPRESTPDEPREPGAPLGEIDVCDVHFAYGEGTPALAGVSLHVPAGSTVAIVGASGSGKSTLVELLLRLRDPDAGSIAIDGVPLAQLARQEVRARIAVVLADAFLYSRTLADNLGFARPSASRDEIVQATRDAAIHDAIEGFAAGYDTLVGERGVTLSGGQRQRVALARALLQRPAVLVLDDALSAVDTATEAAILAALAERRGRHSTLLIAHRLSTVMLADSVIVLDAGRVVQRGRHDDLVATEGPYRRMWELQVASGAGETGS